MPILCRAACQSETKSLRVTTSKFHKSLCFNIFLKFPFLLVFFVVVSSLLFPMPRRKKKEKKAEPES